MENNEYLVPGKSWVSAETVKDQDWFWPPLFHSRSPKPNLI